MSLSSREKHRKLRLRSQLKALLAIVLSVLITLLGLIPLLIGEHTSPKLKSYSSVSNNEEPSEEGSLEISSEEKVSKEIPDSPNSESTPTFNPNNVCNTCPFQKESGIISKEERLAVCSNCPVSNELVDIEDLFEKRNSFLKSNPGASKLISKNKSSLKLKAARNNNQNGLPGEKKSDTNPSLHTPSIQLELDSSPLITKNPFPEIVQSFNGSNISNAENNHPEKKINQGKTSPDINGNPLEMVEIPLDDDNNFKEDAEGNLKRSPCIGSTGTAQMETEQESTETENRFNYELTSSPRINGWVNKLVEKCCKVSKAWNEMPFC